MAGAAPGPRGGGGGGSTRQPPGPPRPGLPRPQPASRGTQDLALNPAMCPDGKGPALSVKLPSPLENLSCVNSEEKQNRSGSLASTEQDVSPTPGRAATTPPAGSLGPAAALTKDAGRGRQVI